MRFIALLLVVTVGCGGSVTWSRSVTINRSWHVALALDTDAAKACYQACLEGRSPAACLERCDGATVIPGPCADADRLPERACFARAFSNRQSLAGRCADSIDLAPGERVAGCAEFATEKPSGIGGIQLIAGAIVFVGLVAVAIYIAVRPPDDGETASAIEAFDARPNRR